ncbi:MAG: hypothetical protein BWZ10_02565 [candidate division BRC1 bacterium ADurb.BinA364]|nr:MAG: hypothetical protein BWZ10_02565 [candidate division BRC1 bacterium ADurb.BinA364]
MAECFGILIEFESPAALKAAAARVRDAGYSRWDSHTPYPVHGLDEAMGLRRTILPLICFAGGLAGAALALGMQGWMNAVDYPFMISGKPPFKLPAFIPILFELTVLLAAFAAFFGMLALNNLPLHSHPVFRSARFARASADRFFISIEAADPAFDLERTRVFAESLGGAAVEILEA